MVLKLLLLTLMNVAWASGPTRMPVTLVVSIDAKPAAMGGRLFYAGFDALDATTGRPMVGAEPLDHGVAGTVDAWPVATELELVKGLDYYVFYGFGEHPLPEDPMSAGAHFEGQRKLALRIELGPMPAEDEPVLAAPSDAGMAWLWLGLLIGGLGGWWGRGVLGSAPAKGEPEDEQGPAEEA
jgi:hypothetical protein